jgi:hypothetical protein
MTSTPEPNAAEAPQNTPPTEQPNLLPVPLNEPIIGLDEAWRLSKALAVATVMPSDLRGKPADVLAMMLYGRDLGLSPMQSIQGIYVVKGKPQLSSQTWTALARRHGHKVRMIESTAEKCTVQITRRDDPDHPHTETFTIEDALQAGLCTRDAEGKISAKSAKGEKLPWMTYTKNMLRNRAISNAGKFTCPEVATGFAIEGDYDYTQDDDDEPVTVTQPDMHRDNVSAADLQAEVLRAEAAFQQPGEDPNIQDAEVVDDPPHAATVPAAATIPTPTVTTAAEDPDAQLFRAADEQAERDMGGSE